MTIDIDIRRQQGDFRIHAAFRSEGGGVTALFGRSGAGKTSIINMVAGLVRPEAGRISVNGKCLFDAERRIDLPPEKRRIGYIFQEGRLFPHLSVRANLMYGMRRTPAVDRYVHFDSVVALLGIGQLLDRRPARLSGGEKQRVAIGRALLTSPSLLLMDEPLASLDSARKSEVLPFISRLAMEFSIPILYVSHALEEILNLADTMVLLDAGRVMAVGAVEELMSHRHLQQLTGDTDYGTVIPTVIKRHDEAAGITHLQFPGGILKLPRIDLPIGRRVRVRIQARNVAIALEPPKRISVQNILRGRIEEITEGNGSLVDIRMNVGCPLLSRITPLARKDLDLQPGQSVFALVKSVAVSCGTLGQDGDDVR